MLKMSGQYFMADVNREIKLDKRNESWSRAVLFHLKNIYKSTDYSTLC